MRFAPDEPLFNVRVSDDPMHRIRMQAETRAKANGFEPIEAGRKAMALMRTLIEMEIDPTPETILTVVAGEFRRAA